MYVLDANVFISAKSLHYGFDFVPGFWDWLDLGQSVGILCSTGKVRQELKAGEDTLSEWVANREALFLATDANIVPGMQHLAAWARSGRFTPAAADEFLRVADFELVAFAHAHNHTVVTHERPNPLAKKRIMIPDACQELGVQWMDPFTMLREAGAKFVLQPPAARSAPG